MDYVNSVRETVEKLREIVASCSTTSVVGWCQTCFHQKRKEEKKERDLASELMSPARQISFLLGLLLASPEPSNPIPLSEEEWRRARRLLNEVYRAYLYGLFFPASPDEISRLTPEWKHVREVAMPAFLHFLGLLQIVWVTWVDFTAPAACR